MATTPRTAVSVAGAAAIIVGTLGLAAVATPAGAAPRSAAEASGANAKSGFWHPSAAVLKIRSQGKHQRVIVMFDNQLKALPDSAAHRQARAAAAASLQAPLLTQLRQVGATDLRSFSLLNAVAADVPAGEVSALRRAPGVTVMADSNVVIGRVTRHTPTVASSRVLKASTGQKASDGQVFCNSSPANPLLEPEALTNIHDASPNPNDTQEASRIATGKGVTVANVGVDDIAGNPNFIRPDGQHVIIDAPNENLNTFNADAGDDEWEGDASTIAAQGTVTYSFATQLPYAHVPKSCTFRIVGDATGVSMLAANYDSNTSANGEIVATASQIIAGDQQVVKQGADVVSESYGNGDEPNEAYQWQTPTNDAMVAAGVVVVEAAGDSGVGGTVEAPADDPNVIDVGGTNDLRSSAQAYGYTRGWLDNRMTTLSSSGIAVNGRTVDLVAPGYGSMSSTGEGDGQTLPTEAFGGTSESTPFVAGAAADVIQAYRQSHKGASPSPAQVKEVLTSTATDIGAPADEQGAGLLDVYAAVKAAQQLPGSSEGKSSLPLAVASPTQVDVQGNGGSAQHATVSLYNASSEPLKVTGSYRILGPEKVLGPATTEKVSAPSSSQAVPAQGATAAAPIRFKVPKGLSVLDADIRWPNPTNNPKNILAFVLTDPQGRLAQISYDYGAANYAPGPTSPDIQHAEVQRPEAGTWTAQIVWSDGRGHLQSPPNVPGPYRGKVVFQASGQTFTTTPASKTVTIAPHATTKVPLSVKLPSTPGDSAESVQFSDRGQLLTSVPVARRTFVPSAAGSKFTATFSSTVSRGAGQIQTFFVRVPKGEKDLDVKFASADHNKDNPFWYFLSSPSDRAMSWLNHPVDADWAVYWPLSAVDLTPTTINPSGNGSLIAADPQPGLWEIDVEQGPQTDGTRFTYPVTGTIDYNQLKPVTETGLPTSSTTTVASGSSVPVSVKVTNTTNHPGDFYLVPSGKDITGGAVSTPLRLAPGATGTLTATLSPTAASGTAVKGTLQVQDSTDMTDLEQNYEYYHPFSVFHTFDYAYTAG